MTRYKMWGHDMSTMTREYNQPPFPMGEQSVRKMRRIRARRRSRRNLILVLLVVVVVATLAGMKAISLYKENQNLAITERQLETHIEEETNRAEELKNREKYMQTKKYIEDEAKNKLGLVYPDEIVIRPSE